MNFQTDNSLFVLFICRVISASWDAEMRPKSLRSSQRIGNHIFFFPALPPLSFMSHSPTSVTRFFDTGFTHHHMIGAF